MAKQLEYIASTEEIQERLIATREVLTHELAKVGRKPEQDYSIGATEAPNFQAGIVDGFHLEFPLTFYTKYRGPRREFKSPRHIGIILVQGGDALLDMKRRLCERCGIVARFVDVTAEGFDVAKAVRDTVNWFQSEIARPEE